MRGLDVRLSLMQARVQATIERTAHPDLPDPLPELTLDAYIDAQLLGGEDAMRGESVPPVLFRNEPGLLASWNDGYDRVFHLEEMDDCDMCASGEMCATHD